MSETSKKFRRFRPTFFGCIKRTQAGRLFPFSSLRPLRLCEASRRDCGSISFIFCIFAQRRIHRLFSPFLRTDGGASHVSCPPLAPKWWRAGDFPPYNSAAKWRIMPILRTFVTFHFQLSPFNFTLRLWQPNSTPCACWKSTTYPTK